VFGILRCFALLLSSKKLYHSFLVLVFVGRDKMFSILVHFILFFRLYHLVIDYFVDSIFWAI
jgi:hypothetical protein